MQLSGCMYRGGCCGFSVCKTFRELLDAPERTCGLVTVGGPLPARALRQLALNHATDDPHIADELACDGHLRLVGVLAARNQTVVTGPVPRIALPCLGALAPGERRRPLR